MADVAVGRNCTFCGTFTACSGSFTDEQLVGQCGCCGNQVTAQAHGGERRHAKVAAGIESFARGEDEPFAAAQVSNDSGQPQGELESINEPAPEFEESEEGASAPSVPNTEPVKVEETLDAPTA